MNTQLLRELRSNLRLIKKYKDDYILEGYGYHYNGDLWHDIFCKPEWGEIENGSLSRCLYWMHDHMKKEIKKMFKKESQVICP